MAEFSYDVTQYFSHPYQQSHPERLALLGKLFGLKPKPWKKARILELGCASGGNCIPMAMAAPEAEVLGIDLSKVQVEDGQQTVKALGLDNIEIVHRSITDITADDGLFDYIIAHGVWSWVPEEVRKSIFAVIRNNMSDQGIAYVSYNTLPGWSTVLNVREMMRYHTKGLKTDPEKATQARALIHFLASGLQNEKSHYANSLKEELQLLSRQTDNYLLHEYLEENNHPVYFHDFMAQASEYNLNYLSDTSLTDMFSHNLPQQFAKQVSQITDIIKANQYTDFIRNKRFRCTLLCHSHHTLNRQLSYEKIQDAFFSYQGQRLENIAANSFEEGESLAFTNGVVTLTISSAISKTAMWILQNQHNKPISLKQLCQMVTRQLKDKNMKEVEAHIKQDLNIMRLVLGGLVEMHDSAGEYTVEPQAKPMVSRLVRFQAEKQHYVTNQRHQLVALNPIEHVLVKQLDGTRTLEDCLPILEAAVLSGEIKMMQEDGSQLTSKAEIAKRLPGLCETMIEKFANSALFVQPERKQSQK